VKAHKEGMIIGIVVIWIIITRFLPISFGDLYNDGAINSFRAFGWLDYFGTSGQTTPLQWFGNIPNWSTLSFHDAPPLAFLIQKIFFVILGGGGTVVARLPFIIAGIGSIWLLYYLLKQLTNRTIASIATITLTVSSYAVWVGQAVYLEGIEEFFIVGSVLFGAYFMFKERNKKYIYIWAIFLSCALLTKYTAIFLIPPIILYAFLYRKELRDKWKNIAIAFVLFITLLSPIIIYNLNLYQNRGHFDAAISSMVGIHSEDFSIISERSLHYNIFSNTINIIKTLGENMSYPLLILALGCFILLIFRIRKLGFKSFESWILINTSFLILILGFAGGTVRFLSIMVPFIAITIGLGVYYSYISINSYGLKKIFLAIIAGIILFELFYSINTNVLKTPVTTSNWLYSENKVNSLGFNELDNFIRKEIIIKLPERNIIKTKEDLVFGNDDVNGRSVVIFDDRINWFAQMWYFQRYFIYYRWPVISTAFLSTANKDIINIEDLMKVSGEPLYFIYPIDNQVMDSIRANDIEINQLGHTIAERFDKISDEITIIKNKNNIPVFKVYRIDHL
jgi:hypothetical protein